MINFDPSRKKTHAVIDMVYGDSCYTGSEEDCIEYVSQQEEASSMAARTYKIIEL